MEMDKLVEMIETKGAIETVAALLEKAGLNEFEANYLISALVEETKDFKHKESDEK